MKKCTPRAVGEIEGRIRNLLRRIDEGRAAIAEQQRMEREMFDWIQLEAFKLHLPVAEVIAGCARIAPDGNLASLMKLEIPGA